MAASEGGGKLGELEARLAALRARMEAGLPERAKELRAALRQMVERPEAQADVVRIAHKLHGVAGSYGLTALGEAAARVEKLGKEESPELVSAAAALLQLLDAAPAGATAPAAAPAPTRRLAGLRIAALDDDDATRRLLELTLRSVGGAESWVLDRLDALRERVRQTKLDLVIVDAMMPETSGLDVIHELRASDPSLRFAILSASTATELGWELGPDALWLRKPFKPTDIVSAVAALFGR